MPDNNDLKLKFDQRTIGDLGVKMYTRLPHALAETISNSYDADAKNVTVEITQTGSNVEKIVIQDDGFGMTFEDIRDNFLIVGRKRRKEEGDHPTPLGRKVTGSKGLGKLALFGIAGVVEIATIKDRKINSFQMNWDDIEKVTTYTGYEPKTIKNNQDTNKKNGTIITLTHIKRKTGIGIKDVSISLSRRFNFVGDFRVVVKDSRDESQEYVLNNELKFQGIGKNNKIEAEFPIYISQEELKEAGVDFEGEIQGVIKTARFPLPKKEMQGVSLVARNKIVNEPTAFGSVSSNFFRYITGELYVDFIDDGPEDLIATNRRSLDWDNPRLESLEKLLRDVVNSQEKAWRKVRTNNATERVQQQIGEEEVKEYKDTLPDDKKEVFNDFLEIETDDPKKSFQILKKILAPYPKYHFRYLHPDLQRDEGIFQDYKNKEYVSVITKAWEIFEKKLQKKCSTKEFGSALVNQVLKINKIEHSSKILQDNPYQSTHNSVRNHFIDLAKSSASASNISRHTTSTTIQEDIQLKNEIFNEQDCLDIISGISFLLYNLDKYTLKS